MTVQCRTVLDTAGFKDSEYQIVEKMLTKVSANKLLGLIKSKNKSVHHDAEWFLPFVQRGYIRSYDLECSFSKEFWSAYQIFDNICVLSVDDLPYIDAMSKDRSRMRKALSQSKVMNVRYIYKVWQGTPEEKITNNVDKIQTVFKSNVSKVVNL